MIQVLSERHFPVGELRLLASGDPPAPPSAPTGGPSRWGRRPPRRSKAWTSPSSRPAATFRVQLAPEAAARGATVIDNSNAWRMEANVPLIVSQVNPEDGEWHEGIIANPNCSTMQLVPVLMALRDAVGLERVVVDTYQSVSGTGAEALAELETQIRAHVAGEPKVGVRLPARDRLQRHSGDRRLPRERLHPRGVEGRDGEPQDPAPAGPAGLVHGRPRPGLREPLRGRPRRDEQGHLPG
jgi:aspartate-semialdehyde dehydrogenase